MNQDKRTFPIEITVDASVKELNQDQLQRLRRIANVLGDAGFGVKVTFKYAYPSADDPFMPAFAGAEYPHPGYLIMRSKEEIKKFSHI